MQVRDLMVASSVRGDAWSVVSELVRDIVRREFGIVDQEVFDRIRINLPYKAACMGDIFKSIEEDGPEDDGWMYMKREGVKKEGEADGAMLEEEWMMWPSDSF